MVQIDDKLLSLDLFEKRFVCDLAACKGACCVEGDSGAPLSEEEASVLEESYDRVKPFMRPEGIAAVEKGGCYTMDQDQELVTTLVKGKECAFVSFDKDGTAKCSIEQAYNEGKVDFKKPISCHLYPIRVKKLTSYIALNYDQWKICGEARSCGLQLDVKVFRFLKEPITRAYGEAFYKAMEEADQELIQGGHIKD